MNENLPLMSYRVCLACGQKTLTYSNGLCRHCVFLINLKAMLETCP